MLIQRLNRTDPEKIFIVIKNSYDSATLTVGQVVAFDYTDEANGVAVTRPTTVLLTAVAGIVADATIAPGAYGLVQTYGHHASALVDGTTSLAAGDNLVMANNVFNLVRMSTDYGGGNQFVMGEAYSTGAAAAKKIFIRCM